ncbi:MAG: sugar kinase [Chloroflexi bacterium]|nr:MAG: sugar kinase [Chloroflexota bacterium]
MPSGRRPSPPARSWAGPPATSAFPPPSSRRSGWSRWSARIFPRSTSVFWSLEISTSPARYTGVRLENRETLDTQLNVFADFHPTLPEAYRDSRLVFLANIQPELQLEVLEQVRDADFIACDTMKLWLDTARPGLERLMRRVHCVLMNDEEAVQFSGQRFLPAAARAILSYGPRAVIIKRGENGSLLFTKERVFLAPAHPLETVRDPTGAGDAFAGGLLGALARAGNDRDDVLRRGMLYGSVLGSLAVEDFSVRRIADTDIHEIEGRLSNLVDMISLDGTRAL